jgi:hypothetical protein
VEAMVRSPGRSDVRGSVIEDSAIKQTAPMPPLFYSGCLGRSAWNPMDRIATVVFSDRLAIYPGWITARTWCSSSVKRIFQHASVRMEQATGPLGPSCTRAEPGALDKLVHWLNPVNRNETITVAQGPWTEPERREVISFAPSLTYHVLHHAGSLPSCSPAKGSSHCSR